jgi:hypothetical protein
MDNRLISIDSDISKDQLWFKVPQDIQEEDATCLFEDYQEEAIKKVINMTDEEARTWMKKNEKLTQRND